MDNSGYHNCVASDIRNPDTEHLRECEIFRERERGAGLKALQCEPALLEEHGICSQAKFWCKHKLSCS